MRDVLLSVSTVIVYAGGLVLHLWAILIAFGNGGFIPALITFFTPPLSVIFWAAVTLQFWPTLFHVAIIIWLLSLGMMIYMGWQLAKEASQ